jgi:hypothetical protein
MNKFQADLKHIWGFDDHGWLLGQDASSPADGLAILREAKEWLYLAEYYYHINLDPQLARFALECAQGVLPLWVAAYPKNRRPQEALALVQVWIDDPTDIAYERLLAARAAMYQAVPDLTSDETSAAILAGAATTAAINLVLQIVETRAGRGNSAVSPAVVLNAEFAAEHAAKARYLANPNGPDYRHEMDRQLNRLRELFPETQNNPPDYPDSNP